MSKCCLTACCRTGHYRPRNTANDKPQQDVTSNQITNISETNSSTVPTEPAASSTSAVSPVGHSDTDTRFPILGKPEQWAHETDLHSEYITLVNARSRTTEADEVTCEDVKRLVQGTWELQHVALGRDARNVHHTRIVVTEVRVVVNPKCLVDYQFKRSQLLARHSNGNKAAVFPGGKPVKSSNLSIDLITLDNTLNKLINEHYLFHGTKQNMVEMITTQGFDTRVCRDRALFGTGVYFSESSTKADQYTDTGDTGYMFVARVLLGNVYKCERAQSFRRPPCMGENCTKYDRCTEHEALFDTVMGVGAPNGRPLLFREFIVYDQMLCYPEFLVKYRKV